MFSAVVGAGVACGIDPELAGRHRGEDHEPLGSGGTGAGGERQDAGGSRCCGHIRLYGVLFDISQKSFKIPVAHCIDHRLVGIRVDGGEDVQIIDPRVGHQDPFAV